jgi:hypothetical protein
MVGTKATRSPGAVSRRVQRVRRPARLSIVCMLVSPLAVRVGPLCRRTGWRLLWPAGRLSMQCYLWVGKR